MLGWHYVECPAVAGCAILLFFTDPTKFPAILLKFGNILNLILFLLILYNYTPDSVERETDSREAHLNKPNTLNLSTPDDLQASM